MKHRVKSVIRGLALSFVVGLTVATGCGSSFKPPQEGNADGAIPEEVAVQIRTCAAKYMGDLPPHDQTISFEVKLASDGEVDSIALHSSTVSHEALEACMAKAIRKLSEDQLSLRGSRRGRGGAFSPEQSRFLGQEELAVGCLASPPCLLTVGFVIAATYLVVAIYVQSTSQSSAVKPTSPPVEIDCKKIKQQCIEHCSDTVLPTRDFGASFNKCMRACTEANGC